MIPKKYAPCTSLLTGLALVLVLASTSLSARANVYATNIKLNGSLTGAQAAAGAPVNISYLLNEPATLGVTVKVLQGTAVVRSISIPPGSAGAAFGLNTVVWDGKDNSNVAVAPGTYSISITPKAVGYTNWTQISSDLNTNLYVPYPRGGLAVDNNTNSPYYGRIFIGNPKAGPNPTTVPGDKLGILKLNADGSYADEGAVSAGGYNFFDDGYYDVPRRLRMGQDDRLYILDWSGYGKVVAFDPIMSTNQVVLDQPNYASNPYFPSMSYGWGVFDVTDAGTTNARVWLGDSDFPSAGIYVWSMTNGVADPNDTSGTQAADTSGSMNLLPSGGFMVDVQTNIWVAQERDNTGDANNRAMVLTNWDGVTPASQAAWAVGGSDDGFRYDFDLAIDSRISPKYVVAAMYSSLGLRFLSPVDGSVLTNGDGTILTNFNFGTSYRNVAWDNAGNLYATASVLQRLQIFSPPSGTNQATTFAVPKVVIIQPPQVTSISVAAGTVTINFTGATSDTASTFGVVGSATVAGPYSLVSNANISLVAPGAFKATIPATEPLQFYRIRK